MTNNNKRRGDNAERLLVAWLRDNGFPNAERAYGAGRPDDVGDIDGIPGVVIECKNQQRLDLAGWVTETEHERRQAGADHGLLIVKRRGHTNPGRWYCVMELEGAALLLKEAGW